MTRIISLSIIVVLIFCQKRNSIFVEFEVDDKKIQMIDNFEMHIVLNGNSKKVTVAGNSVELPDIDESMYPVCDVIFEHDFYRLEFKKVSTKQLKWSQDITWAFRVDNPPFYENYEGVDWSKVKKIHYWSFKPHEVGEGYELIEPVF